MTNRGELIRYTIGPRRKSGLQLAAGVTNPSCVVCVFRCSASRRVTSRHVITSSRVCRVIRAYRIGRYCPICDRSFIGPKGTMQLVICKLCDRQLHQDCVRQTVSRLDVMDYTCGGCRRSGITSRAAAARVAPRTIATLFMAKRRFNKYAHRQYMESRMRSKMTPPEEDDND
ncbi:hypothetical protein EVAR_53893_1 [Eumeta japonica]|uniref:PHD-type domain-containing protein n=1 Tax=Eumeta variegata TaxID=151549 RepID=A0A4C1YGJ9_EUMVA|nr:hypothetical protein EVAR_53893_1 [Eumeta japonica]